MNKTELIEAVVKETGLKKKDAEQAVVATFAAIENELTEGGKVQLIGFGTFGVKTREARTGRNPSTGETIEIAEAKVPVFSAGSALKAKLNK